ncbi:hypothetical protein ABTF26_19345, partial [Acinetobacter baumannii]
QQWAFVAKRSQLDTQTSLGRTQLRTLTGTTPHKFETLQGFIARVSMPEPAEKIADKGSKATR